MTLEFETMTPAGRFGDTCETPIMDLRRLCNDDVLRNLPRFLGRWEDNTNQTIITDSRWDIETSENDCDPSVASNELAECTVILPNQRLVSIGFAEMPYRDTLQKFCSPRGITRYPTLFNSDGSFRMAEPLADRFITYLLSELRHPLMRHLQNAAWTGDQDTRHQFEGLLNQLDNGPFSAGGGCDLYHAIPLDWEALTDSTGAANPNATIAAANDVITIQGVDFAGMTGLNLVQLLRLWMERALEFDLAAWAEEEVMFELWVGRGQANCILEAAACLQPCTACVDPLSDPGIRERAARFIKDRVFSLYPYDNISITLRTSPALNNRMIFLPKMIGGAPTVAWVFRDQEMEMGILSGELPWYGTETGLPETTPIYPGEDDIIDGGDFERRAFSLHLQRNGNCIQAFINTEAALVVFSPQLWLNISGVDCAALIPAECEPQGLPVAVADCTDDAPGSLILTVVALETALGATPDTGSTFLVSFADGVTQLVGTASAAYNTGTDALTLSFGVATIECADFAGTADFGPATVAPIVIIPA